MRPLMKAGKTSLVWNALCAVCFLVLFATLANSQSSDPGWPRTILTDSTQMVIYQPQVDSWQNGKLEARAAVAATERTTGQSLYGTVWLSGKTTLDQEKRLVTLYDIDAKKATFPSAGAQESTYVTQVSDALQRWNMSISLDRLLADIAITQNEEKTANEDFSTTRPKIFVRQNPAVLILIDGEPVMQKVPDSKLMRVLNSPAMIVLDTDSKQYFLRGESYWMTAPAISGPWRKADNPPASLAAVLAPETATTSAGTNQTGVVPEAVVSTEPAELIQIQGEPQFSPIEGTRLLYVTNTDSDVFLSLQQQRYYVLLSGRWFSSATLNGSWEFVAGSALPVDFAQIPPEHPKATVLASVPGTSEARDAVVAAQVPQTATVDRKKATFTATYDGEPKFKHIHGTEMSYAMNSPNDIIEARGKYYAADNGVWFVATNPLGPWEVCDFVPPEIYSLPPTVPVYHAKYVYVYDATPDYVYVGYLPGYFGDFIWDGVVVYGTGWWYPAWYGNYWWGWPWTWGFGCHYGYWGGGYFWRPWYPRPWYWHRWRWEPVHPVWWSNRVLYNRAVRGTITARANAPHPTVYSRWQSPAVTYRNPVSLRPPSRVTARPGITAPRELAPQRPRVQRPDIYAGRNGQIYSHRNDGWYRQHGRNWEKVSPVSPPGAAPRIEEMERNREARIQGENRIQQYRNITPPQRSVAPPPRMSTPMRGGGRHR